MISREQAPPFIMLQGWNTQNEPVLLGVTQPAAGGLLEVLAPAVPPSAGVLWQQQGNYLVNAAGGLVLAANDDGQPILAEMNLADPSQTWSIAGVQTTDPNTNNYSGLLFQTLDADIGDQYGYYLRYNEGSLCLNLGLSKTPQIDYTDAFKVLTPGGLGMPLVVLDNQSDATVYFTYAAKAGLVDTTLQQPVPVGPWTQTAVLPLWDAGLALEMAVYPTSSTDDVPLASFTYVQRTPALVAEGMHVHGICTCLDWALEHELLGPGPGTFTGIGFTIRRD